MKAYIFFQTLTAMIPREKTSVIKSYNGKPYSSSDSMYRFVGALNKINIYHMLYNSL